MHRRIPSWWRVAGESRTKLLYQPEKPVVCKRDLFPLGKCDEDQRPGTGSRLFYIRSWAMCWPTDHPKKPKT